MLKKNIVREPMFSLIVFFFNNSNKTSPQKPSKCQFLFINNSTFWNYSSECVEHWPIRAGVLKLA